MSMRIRLPLLTWATFCALSTSAIQADLIGLAPRDSRKHLELPKGNAEIDKAIECFQRRDYDRCFELLKGASKKDANLSSARLMLAKLFLLENELARGRATLEQAALENKEDPETYIVFGYLALEEGRLTDALLQFDKAVALLSSGRLTDQRTRAYRIQCHDGITVVAERRKDWSAAELSLSTWLQFEPKNGTARQHLGWAFFRLGKREKA